MNASPVITHDTLLAALSKHIGAAHGVTIVQLSKEITPTAEQRVCTASERYVRRLIEELRSAGHHICAHPSTGYYLASTPEELDQTCLFLHDRAMTSLRQVAAMKRVSVPDLRGQLNLPT